MTSIFAIALIVLVALACASVPNVNRRGDNSTTDPSSSTTGSSAAQPAWYYDETEDQMSGRKIYLASIRSSNTISLDSPTADHNVGLWFYVNIHSTAKTYIY